MVQRDEYLNSSQDMPEKPHERRFPSNSESVDHTVGHQHEIHLVGEHDKQASVIMLGCFMNLNHKVNQLRPVCKFRDVTIQPTNKGHAIHVKLYSWKKT